MNHPLHAPYFADGCVQVQAEIVENRRLAKDTQLVRFAAPEIARRIQPGQFVMLRIAGYNDPLIGRPLALYDTYGPEVNPDSLSVVYLVKRKFTTRMASLQAGQKIDVWGPLGNGFIPEPTEHLLMVAGGIGQTPFLAVAKEALGQRRYGSQLRWPTPVRHVTFCYGARTADYLTGIEDFEKLGVSVKIATDDGSRGHHGLVTDLVNQTITESHGANGRGAPRILCCGPEPMMEAVAHLAAQENVPCQVSLETPMACGIGICFTCVAKVRDEQGDWDYKRTCVEGPVFDATKIEW
jgi:dihydroorotate dehydrogenase electron transfer subunit